ncbi:MAG: mandelate racemase/muconate lactonizing enzyme family protein, partial [Chloroflexota bacterium]
KSIWQSMVKDTYWFGPAGIITFAISAIDIALWDLLGKITGKPLYVLLGGSRDRVPCYYTGFRRSTPVGELGEEALTMVRQGFTAFKVKLGGEDTLEKEIERVKAVREAIGDGYKVMVDPNQAWTADQTIMIGDSLEKYDIYWLEDPIPYEDMEGRVRVASCLDIPIASGEDIYTRSQFRELAENKAADIFNVDLQRVGGVTGWLDVTSFLEGRALPFAGHWFSEIQCHLFAASQKGLTLEYMPWHFGLYKQTPKIENGLIELPKGPGLGWEIDEEALRRYEAK